MANLKLQDRGPADIEPGPRRLLLLTRQVLGAHFANGDWQTLARRAGVTPAQSCFVSLKVDRQLRGCIGTFDPLHRTLEEEVAENAVAAATRDPRFDPLRAEEMAGLQLSIDLLGAQQAVGSRTELDPAQYGLVVQAGKRLGVLLPDLPGVTTVEQQERICREKAGIESHEAVELFRFTVQRILERPQGVVS